MLRDGLAYDLADVGRASRQTQLNFLAHQAYCAAMGRDPARDDKKLSTHQEKELIDRYVCAKGGGWVSE